jgi:uncharacterized phage-associated protein
LSGNVEVRAKVTDFFIMIPPDLMLVSFKRVQPISGSCILGICVKSQFQRVIESLHLLLEGALHSGCVVVIHERNGTRVVIVTRSGRNDMRENRDTQNDSYCMGIVKRTCGTTCGLSWLIHVKLSSLSTPGGGQVRYKNQAAAADAVLGLMVVATEECVAINTTKVAKLLFLADLRAVEKLGHPISGFDWIWWDHGPWDHAVFTVISTLEREGRVSNVLTQHAGYSERVLTLSHEDSNQAQVDREFLNIVHEIVRGFGRRSAKDLEKITYTTPPMLEVQRGGSRGDDLDLHGGTAVPPPHRVDAVLAKFRAVAKRLPTQQDEGDLSAMQAEHEEFEPVRLRANSAIL